MRYELCERCGGTGCEDCGGEGVVLEQELSEEELEEEFNWYQHLLREAEEE